MDRSRSSMLGVRGLLAVWAMVVLTGCPGSIDDPSRFRGQVGSCPTDYDVEEELFRRTCGQLACHTGGPGLAAAGLDLTAPGVGERLLVHTSEECGGRPLLDPYHLDDSYLIAKIDQDDPPCGERMPSGMAPLNPLERACLDAYLDALVATVGDGAVPMPRDAGIEPALDAGPDAGAAEAPSPVTFEAEAMELSGYVEDAVNPGVIRVPDGATEGRASTTFGGAAGTYQVTLEVRAETDGQPTIRLIVAGGEVASETYPLAAAADLEPVTLGPFEVALAPGDTIEVHGQVGGDAWARVDRVRLAP